MRLSFRVEHWEASSRLVGPLGGLLGASRRPLGGLLEASWGVLGVPWGPLGGFLGVLEGDFNLSIILEGSSFSGGPPWRHLGVVFLVF